MTNAGINLDIVMLEFAGFKGKRQRVWHHKLFCYQWDNNHMASWGPVADIYYTSHRMGSSHGGKLVIQSIVR